MSVIKHLNMPQNHKVAPKIATKFFVPLVKPIISMLVFLFASGLAPKVLDNAELPTPCVSRATSSVLLSGLQTAAQYENKQIQVGKRVLVVTKHAALRMAQRNVSVASVQRAVESGKLFAYLHQGRVKIGYYDHTLRLFLSVDKRHEKIITAIRNSSKQYMDRLIDATINTTHAGK